MRTDDPFLIKFKNPHFQYQGEDMKFRYVVLLAGFLFYSSLTHAETLKPGSLDSMYGVNGVVNEVVGVPIRMNAAVLQSDDKIVVAGSSLLGGNQHFALARFTKEGKLDPSFGQNGISLIDASKEGNFNSNAEDSIQAIKMQGDKMIVSGFVTNSKNDGIS